MKLSKKFSKKIKSKAVVLLCAITAICAILATDKVINKQNSIFQYIANSISTTSTSGSETSATDSNIIKSGYNICVSTTGNDETGDGTKEKPYATLSKAINEATSGQKIYIMAGTYTLTPMPCTSYSQSGIYDMGKNIEIFGENEKQF